MAKEVTPQVVDAVHRMLTEDYPSNTREHTEEVVAALIRGEKPTDIIGMFAKSALEKAGYLD